MHQHPRPPPVMASPANSEQTNPTRTNNPRDRDVEALRTASPVTQGSGSSDEFGNAKQEQPIERLNQVIRNFHTKAALIILHSRVELPPAFSRGTEVRRVNKWFNIELDETEEYKDDIKIWKTCDLKDERPPPLVIEVFLNTDALNQGQRLVLLDDEGKRWDVKNALAPASGARSGKNRAPTDTEVILERWVIELGDQTAGLPSDMAALLPLVYKKSIVLFRSLFTYCNFLPAFKLSRKIGRRRSSGAVKLSYRIVDGSRFGARSQSDSLIVPLCESTGNVVSDYSFGVTESPAGPFSVFVTYRQNCEFRVDDSEELLSRQFLGSDDDLYQPSLPGEDTKQRPKTSAGQEVGSLPTDHRKNLMSRPELGQAYGSLSTFHQAGIGTGTSPISALRNAQDFSADSPSPPTDSGTGFPAQPSNQSSRSSLRPTTAGTGRRSSFSFQPFKAPVLSASPLAASPLASSPRPSISRVSALSPLAEERTPHSSSVPAHVARKSISLAPEQAVASSASSSPKPAPITRYSSSFSHRRARLSSGGTPKTEDDQNSSGQVSATSSAQPGSGLMAEAAAGGGGSSGSMQEDDENITDFLKMLDLKKDLLTPSDAASAEASTRRTTAALNRFHRMRDSNAALSDSMSSSIMMHRSSSSSSRQLSSVPPMVAATSVSTSSSPGKPISPHTPHTPFAPSRLSAAYSHEDTDTHRRLPVVAEPPSPSEPTSDDTAQTTSTVNVSAIDIPSSPRPFLSNFRRSSSAQRGPLPEDDDGIGGVYAMSLDAQERRVSRAPSTRPGDTSDGPGDSAAAAAAAAATAADVGCTKHRRLEVSPRRSSLGRATFGPAVPSGDGAGSGSASGQSSAHVYRSRLARGGAGRGVTPPQGSTSSFGGTGGSVERDRDSGSGSGSWGRGVRRSGSKPENRFDDDEFLFTMEKSDFTTTTGGEGASKR